MVWKKEANVNGKSDGRWNGVTLMSGGGEWGEGRKRKREGSRAGESSIVLLSREPHAYKPLGIASFSPFAGLSFATLGMILLHRLTKLLFAHTHTHLHTNKCLLIVCVCVHVYADSGAYIPQSFRVYAKRREKETRGLA